MVAEGDASNDVARRRAHMPEGTGAILDTRSLATDHRRLAALLRPGLAVLDGLVDAARGEGVAVELTVDGAPQQLAPGPDLAAYRIVQDGLAQARGRDGVTRVEVRLRWRRDALEIEIDDDGRVLTGAGGDGPIELAAMRERLALYDGTIEATRRGDGVSSLRARLPLEAAS